MSKLKLDIDEAFDIALIGISCHEKDFRFAWVLNTYAGLNLKRAEDIEIRGDVPLYFPHYVQLDEEQFLTYRCIVNRFSGMIFLSELKDFDYLLMIEGDGTSESVGEVMQRIQQIETIILASKIDWKKLKQKDLILF